MLMEVIWHKKLNEPAHAFQRKMFYMILFKLLLH